MPYDFDTIIDRTGTNSIKWSYRRELAGREDVIPMWVADMDFAVAPEIVEAIKARAAHPVYGYPGRPDAYFEAFRTWANRRYGWEIEREWIVHVPGVVPAVNLAVNAYTEPGDGVVIQGPVYHPFRQAVERNGRRVVDNPLRLVGTRWTFDLEDLGRKADEGTKLVILSNPHNPVGRAWSRDELSALAELCARKNLVVVSDEIHADLLAPGARHVPFAAVSPDAAARSITCHSASKSFNIAGFNTACAVIPDSGLRARFEAMVVRLGLGTPNVFGLVAQEAAYARGRAWLEELLVYLRGNYERLCEALAPSPIIVHPLEGTYLAWLDCGALMLEDAALKRFFIDKAGVWLDEGIKFGPEGSGFMRMNLACPRATLDAALVRIWDALEALPGPDLI